ncbi:MAG: glycosyltransferase [Phycisphaerae bacterium]|nr:glycosyltransferase [Phycisphaerae bacterium]
MNVFMLGWEFPPFISGGLGTACYGLTRAMNELGHHIVFVLPQPVSSQYTTHVRLKSPVSVMSAAPGSAASEWEDQYASYTMKELGNVEFRSIPSALQAYAAPDMRVDGHRVGKEGVDHDALLPERELDALVPTSVLGGAIAHPDSQGQHYAGDMFAEVHRYARIAVKLAQGEVYDVIHAHDWMTYPAGIAVARSTGKPLVIHVHSTEFDRSGEHVNQRIYDIERQGIHAAQKVICVSHLTRNIVLSRYAADPAKVEVVYNAIDTNGDQTVLPPTIRKDEKIVLFLGRITMQKGPEYFLAAAQKVLEYEQNVRFVMAGSGDLIRRAIEMAAEMGIGHKVVFTGFLRGDDVARVFKMADLYVMPSVSEPFGLAPLEALSHDVPVLISKQSGVSEILGHALKVDFWDVNEMANKIVAVLRHPPLQTTLREHGSFEVRKLTWSDCAQGCVHVYEAAVAAVRTQGGN